ncbi:MAG: hypothetical protein AAF671_07885 [Pseudomonadota bacterium]
MSDEDKPEGEQVVHVHYVHHIHHYPTPYGAHVPGAPVFPGTPGAMPAQGQPSPAQMFIMTAPGFYAPEKPEDEK